MGLKNGNSEKLGDGVKKVLKCSRVKIFHMENGKDILWVPVY